MVGTSGIRVRPGSGGRTHLRSGSSGAGQLVDATPSDIKHSQLSVLTHPALRARNAAGRSRRVVRLPSPLQRTAIRALFLPRMEKHGSPDPYGTEALSDRGTHETTMHLPTTRCSPHRCLPCLPRGPPRPLGHETPRGARSTSPQNRLTASDGDSCTRRETDRKTEGERQIDGPYATKTAHSQTR